MDNKVFDIIDARCNHEEYAYSQYVPHSKHAPTAKTKELNAVQNTVMSTVHRTYKIVMLTVTVGTRSNHWAIINHNGPFCRKTQIINLLITRRPPAFCHFHPLIYAYSFKAARWEYPLSIILPQGDRPNVTPTLNNR